VKLIAVFFLGRKVDFHATFRLLRFRNRMLALVFYLARDSAWGDRRDFRRASRLSTSPKAAKSVDAGTPELNFSAV
jgi:hypothetical protein